MKRKNDLIALLIDGDNARASLLKPVIEEVSKYGKVTIRRIYGDWTNMAMSSWKKVLNDVSFTPVQKFSYTTGKNSTDSALIIDAMDILHTGNVDGFCIVSSDSDYTGLAKRIREEGIFVMGIGEKKTPAAFVQSCEIFTFTETITQPPPTPDPIKPRPATKTPVATAKVSASGDYEIINKAFDSATNEQDSTYISTIGSHIRRLDPSFDPRNFGYKTLTQLFNKLPAYEVFYLDGDSNKQVPMVRRQKA